MKLEYTTVSDDEPVEIDDEEVALPSQLTEPAALAYKTHPMIPYAEPAFRLVLRGKTYIVKESDLALIDLTPAKGRRWREHGVSDYRVAVHRGWMAPPKNRGGTHKISTNYVPYNPANLGFLDAGRNRQISATYELDINKVKIDHKHWREHVQLIRQWHKVDTMINEDHDIINWARKHNKRMHPLIRSYYRLKRAADKMETIAFSEI